MNLKHKQQNTESVFSFENEWLSDYFTHSKDVLDYSVS